MSNNIRARSHFRLDFESILANFPLHLMRLNSICIALLAVVIGLYALPASAESESEIRQFLYSTPNTYGWQPFQGDISYDFFKDGRLHVQGADGEATMWEGTWKLKNDRITLKIPALKTNRTLTVTIDGQELLLDDVRYRRYAP